MDDIDQSLARKLRKRMNMITRLPIKTKVRINTSYIWMLSRTTKKKSSKGDEAAPLVQN